MSIIGIVFPCIFGMFMIEKLDKNWKLSIKDYIYIGSIIILLSNCIMFIISILFWNANGNIANWLDYYPMFFVKYVIVSMIVNFVLAILVILIKKYVKIYISLNGKKNE